MGLVSWIFEVTRSSSPNIIWAKVFKNRRSKICVRQPLKNLKGYHLPKTDHTPSNYLKAVFYKFCLVHSWILCTISIYSFYIVALKSRYIFILREILETVRYPIISSCKEIFTISIGPFTILQIQACLWDFFKKSVVN